MLDVFGEGLQDHLQRRSPCLLAHGLPQSLPNEHAGLIEHVSELLILQQKLIGHLDLPTVLVSTLKPVLCYRHGCRS